MQYIHCMNFKASVQSAIQTTGIHQHHCESDTNDVLMLSCLALQTTILHHKSSSICMVVTGTCQVCQPAAPFFNPVRTAQTSSESERQVFTIIPPTVLLFAAEDRKYTKNLWSTASFHYKLLLHNEQSQTSGSYNKSLSKCSLDTNQKKLKGGSKVRLY